MRGDTMRAGNVMTEAATEELADRWQSRDPRPNSPTSAYCAGLIVMSITRAARRWLNRCAQRAAAIVSRLRISSRGVAENQRLKFRETTEVSE
jgi:hypothetical protein